ncbi:adenosylmethionine decarboxylase [Paratrimastix pyriformis]|uniref:adenosylmethionine decarboxylase n=1 Tax=Paratrimastix pyriformis TaxID=342808 RepID=A0ABQ8UWI1_9EUKA|nr:adenosylmethionine decarboxylase [Paratrimastix pyriformis]|eukprot:GAFH01001657.1.p1 GENE.GAFH01001657.1~~GAFH01001657.1.p1  ORF type:complete len:423 (-),score=109.74 GAFH01001657.1:56-1324(-)
MSNRFEGNEKKLELDFVVQSDDKQGLRRISRSEWDAILLDGHCSIVSRTSNSYIDSYVLSESSLFVFRHKVIIKTCGTTTLLDCLPRLTDIARSYGYEMDFLQYSRRNFFFPSDQISVHRDFESEVEWLDSLYPGECGGANILGSNGGRWYVYTLDRDVVHPHHCGEQTIEVCMYQLDPSSLQYFFRNWCMTNPGPGGKAPLTSTATDKEVAERMSTASGFRKLVEHIAMALQADHPHLRDQELLIDEFAFTPCGYSVNVLLGDVFMTVHITPEPHQCYVSYETNAPCVGYTQVVQEVVELFQPSNFAVNLSADRHSAVGSTGAQCGVIKGYSRASSRQKALTRTLMGSTSTYLAVETPSTASAELTSCPSAVSLSFHGSLNTSADAAALVYSTPEMEPHATSLPPSPVASPPPSPRGILAL